MNILVTGGAGFIGSYLLKALLDCGNTIYAIDNLNHYYDVQLKKERLKGINSPNFHFYPIDLCQQDELKTLFETHRFDIVVHLAAQAGVRYSIENPDTYVQSNLIGFYHILQLCRQYPVKHFVFASSSSVYGDLTETPFREEMQTDRPVSFYAATKIANEAMAYAYSQLYQIPTTAVRFFTVYGPMGRPDMAYFQFSETWAKQKKITIFNHGNCYRDFTYIDDIVDGLLKIIDHPPTMNPPFERFNIGHGSPVSLMEFIETLFHALQKYGVISASSTLNDFIEYTDKQKGDVDITYASTQKLESILNYKPNTSIQEGLDRFAKWYAQYSKKESDL